jgi:NAD(P)-dependent dehydrogenase (short-subunit alcohol dehydrogenase family)
MSTPRKFSIDPEEFAGKRVLVTGGTKGAGEPIVRRLGAASAVTVTAARSALPAGQSPNVFVQADLATVAGVDAVVRTVLDELGGIDILVHTLGGSSAPGGGFASLTEDIWHDELSLNLLAAVRLDRAPPAHDRARLGGRPPRFVHPAPAPAPRLDDRVRVGESSTVNVQQGALQGAGTEGRSRELDRSGLDPHDGSRCHGEAPRRPRRYR